MTRLILLLSIFSFGFTPFAEKPKHPKIPKDFAHVPSGLMQTSQGARSIQGFYISKTEISNAAYRAFLEDLKANKRQDDYDKARIHPEGWEQAMTYSGPMVEHYHQHPAYDHYPVVNITREGAELYCQWLSQALQAQNSDWNIKVRLPQELEWQYAAQGGRTAQPYPHGDQLEDEKGHYLYHFRPSDEAALKAQGTDKSVTKQMPYGPAICKSYVPNDYGLYNLSGNVAEMLAEEGRTRGGSYSSSAENIRIDGPDEFAGFKGFSPHIGFRPVISAVARQ